MQKPSYGVMVARCQVPALHAGHLELFNEVRNRKTSSDFIIENIDTDINV